MNSKYLPDSIKIKIRAAHLNYVNHNNVLYTVNAASNGGYSWITPYKKPNLVQHDNKRDPVGRILNFEVTKIQSDSKEPADFVRLESKITDKDAIDKILDGRYFSVSVGSRTTKVMCSECNQILNDEGLCAHKKGELNSVGKPIYWIIDQITYTECSFVNDPADEYARIEEVDFGNGWVNYNTFLDQREEFLNNFIKLEDSMTDAKLSSAQRNNLPDSSFCYVVTQDGKKIRKFPAHDAAHVLNGLARLPQAKLSDAVKAKILACLKRRAKKYDIKVTSDANEDLNLDLTLGYTEDDMKVMNTFFQENPDFDELSDATPVTSKEPEPKEISSMKKDELISFVDTLQKKHQDELKIRDEKIKTLETQIVEKDAILIERENEVNKFIDENSLLDAKIKSIVIGNLIDLVLTKNQKEKREDLIQKYTNRTVESLIDSLNDQRMSLVVEDKSTKSPIVPNPVAPSGTNNEEVKLNNTDNNNKANDEFAIFSKERITEVE